MQSLPVRFSSCSEKQLEETSAEQMASSPSSVMPQSGERLLLIHSRWRFELLRMKLQSAVTPVSESAFPVMLSATSEWSSVAVLMVTHSARIPGSVMLLSGMSDRNHTNSPEVACGDRGKGYA